MPTSNLSIAKAAAATSSNSVWIGEQLAEEIKTVVDTVNVLTGDVARTVASGTVGIATTGVATFSADQTGIIAAGDYIVVAGVKYTIVSGATTSWTVTPKPSTAVAGGTAYVPYNTGSYVDFPSIMMPGCRPIPELFRIRYGGTGTLNATYQFVRVNALSGAETAVTTAVATTAAAVTTFAAAVATEQLPFTNQTGLYTDLPVNEFLRLVCTARTTTTTGRTMLVEMAYRKAAGPNCMTAAP